MSRTQSKTSLMSVVYVDVEGRPETIEFNKDDDFDEMQSLFQSAAEVAENSIIKLYDSTGKVLRICSSIKPNTEETRYQLKVIAAVPWKFAGNDAIGREIEDLEKKLTAFEEVWHRNKTTSSDDVFALKQQMEHMIEKVTTVPHLSWIGLYKGWSGNAPTQFFGRIPVTRVPGAHAQLIFANFVKYGEVQLTQEVRNHLKSPTFDNWQWEEFEMLLLLKQMFIELDLHTIFHIPLSILSNWLCEICLRYNQVPFHNFKHCFMVTQMAYALIWVIGLRDFLQSIDIFILLVAAMCHDIDHPGYNNSYQINARTELARVYNNQAPLENHHCSTCFEVMDIPGCNIIRRLTPDQYKRFREGTISLIMATDMSKHDKLLNEFKAILPVFDINEYAHKDKLMGILMKVADISNEARPMDVSMPWIECLFAEFSTQAQTEKREGIIRSAFMDNVKVNKASAQVGFIRFVLLPLYQGLAELFPAVIEYLVDPVNASLTYWLEREQAQEVEEARRVKELAQTLESEIPESPSRMIHSRF